MIFIDSITALIVSAALAIFSAVCPAEYAEPVELSPFPAAPVEDVRVNIKGGDILWYKTHDYFGGFEGYGVRLIRSEKELSDFYESYREHEQLKEFIKDIDFSKTALAYETVTLSSGSIGCEFRGAAVYDVEITFDYKLNYPEVGTCDMAMIYLFAKIPTEMLG